MVDRGTAASPMDSGERVVPASIDELIAALPKVELHVHLEGSMQPALLLELARKHGVGGLPASLEAVREWYEFRDFPHFIDVYLAVVQTLRDIGFNVGGIEVNRDPFAPVFDRARVARLHSVPHAGETHGPDRIWSAIRRLGAERIGHGIRCLDDPALVEYLRSTQLPLDVCPTSNRRTGAVPLDRPHPLPTLLDAGLMVTLNSDDPPMFGTDLSNEYRVAYGLGLSAADLADLARNGVRASFMDADGKTALLAEIDEVCAG